MAAPAGPPIAIPTIEPIIGAAFLSNLPIDLKKNSGCPVSGFIEFNSFPTTYRSGFSIPIAFICLNKLSLNEGFASKTSLGITVSPSAA